MRPVALPEVIDQDAPIFSVSVAAGLAGMHPQTLRGYDRMGLVVPRRAKGRGRRYSPRDVTRLRLIQHLSQEEGINLNGIRRIIELENEMENMRERAVQMAELMRQMTEVQDEVQRVFTAGSQGAVDYSRFRRPTTPPAIES